MAGRKLTFRRTGETCRLLLLYALSCLLSLRGRPGTWEFLVLLRMGILAVLPFSLRLLPISFSRFLYLPPLLILEGIIFPFLQWNLPALLLFLTADLLLLCRFSRKSWLPVCLSVLPAAAVLLLYDGIICTLSIPAYYAFFRKYGGGPLAKGGLLLLTAVLFCGFFFLLIRHLAEKRFRLTERITAGTDFTEQLHGLETYILAVFCSALLFLGIIKQVYIPDMFSNAFLSVSADLYRHLRQVWQLLLLLILALHGLYICLLVRTIALRRRMQSREETHAALSRFTAGLEKNLQDMRGVRHDMKNLLLTMGGFVSRSNDPDLQRFWQEQITPCLEDTIRRSAILDQLREITDERLKAFLYFKLSLAADLGVSAVLDIRLSDKPFSVTGDLIRLLGIFLDNAIEETVLTGGGLQISLVRCDPAVQIRITNPVRPETRIRGIRPGVSSRGADRGSGLIIAGEIVKRYENLLWNSCLTEDTFTQILLLTE